MSANFLTKLFGGKNEKIIKSLKQEVEQINLLSSKFSSLSDQQLLDYSKELKSKFDPDIDDKIRKEAFALCREVSDRVLGMRHFDEQVMVGLVLDNGSIAEMKTGEGKTLASVLSAYYNSFKGTVHIVTANEYLAKRDCEMMRPLYEALGLTVGYIDKDIQGKIRQSVHSSDVVYGTSTDFAFDYLKDHTAPHVNYTMYMHNQVNMSYCIVDEADAILIDMARTPLNLTEPKPVNQELIKLLQDIAVNYRVMTVNDEDDLDEVNIDGYDAFVVVNSKISRLTEQGQDKLEELLLQHGIIQNKNDLYSQNNINISHLFGLAISSNYAFAIGVDYVNQNGKIEIIDPQSGRVSPGRRWSGGLHQAIEAKEGVNILSDNVNIATITIQNYFRQYKKLSGMTGTAVTEAEELSEIYKTGVVSIPTRKPMIREDRPDLFFGNKKAKMKAIAEDIKNAIEKHQPVLIGTNSLSQSEEVATLLSNEGIAYELLNAKNHERESEIIANAGKPGAVTISTNMAGRGTDIVLGGKPEKGKEKQHAEQRDIVVKAGGLYVIGIERNTSRRLDLQLIGRSGRQGDPGMSQYYLSDEDELFSFLGKKRFEKMFNMFGLQENDSFSHPLVDKGVNDAQKKISGSAYDDRLRLIKNDDTINIQRSIVYDMRDECLEGLLGSKDMEVKLKEGFIYILDKYIPEDEASEWDVGGLIQYTQGAMKIDLSRINDLKKVREEEGNIKARNSLIEQYMMTIKQFKNAIGSQNTKMVYESLYLLAIDTCWKEQINKLESTLDAIGLRSYARKNPDYEFKREAIELFEDMLDEINVNFSSNIIFNMNKVYAQKINQMKKAS